MSAQLEPAKTPSACIIGNNKESDVCHARETRSGERVRAYVARSVGLVDEGGKQNVGIASAATRGISCSFNVTLRAFIARYRRQIGYEYGGTSQVR